MRRFALATLMIAVLAALASANGRPPATSTIHFEQGAEQNVVAGMTFGVVMSHDNGATWQWMCEASVGYGGMYDPGYEYTQTGAIFATTFDGLKVNRDGCTFAATPPGTTFVTALALGGDHALYYGASDVSDSKIYKSVDDGMTFPVSANPGIAGDSWESLAVAPSDPTRVYLTGYRFVKACLADRLPVTDKICTSDADCVQYGDNAHCETQKRYLLFESSNGGTSFTPMGQAGITTTMNSLISIAGIDPTNPDIVYVRSSLEDAGSGDGIFKTTNGQTWTKIFEKLDSPVSFVARANGDLVAATPTLGFFKSVNGGTSFTAIPNTPHANCLYENAAGELWACTQNFGTMQSPSDGYGIMKSTDAASWTGLLKFQDIQQPVTCATGTAQRDQCVESYQGKPSVWCCLAGQLGITSMTPDCTQPPLSCALAPLDGATDGGPGVTKPAPGCCETGGAAAPGALVLALACGAILTRRRRTRC